MRGDRAFLISSRVGSDWAARIFVLTFTAILLIFAGSGFSVFANPPAASAGKQQGGNAVAGSAWWSFQPIVRPQIPVAPPADAEWIRTPIDAFVLAKLKEKGLAPSPQADRRTLIRRVSFDLCGLPPSPAEITAFENDMSPRAYEKVVDRLLASPRYGERWARHWLDTVHYADTHGYDKDKVRPNAWPYRDYVIRAFNDDKPYARFVKEQLAGDALYPGTADGIAALGFIAAGPFDFVGQTEVREGTLDKTITRNLDRDDMVQATMNTFVSLTVQCARCHHHKFDPIGQEDYYSLQAVFAGVDRADRPFDADPSIAKSRHDLQEKIAAASVPLAELTARIDTLAGPELPALDAKISAALTQGNANERPEFGYHSAIEKMQDCAKWVQVDLGKQTSVARLTLVAAHDLFNNIGDGFGFPIRFRIEASDDPAFASKAITIVDQTREDFPNPGAKPLTFSAPPATSARYIRITATRLAPRMNDYIFAMGEMSVLAPDGINLALNHPVTSLDSIEAPPRWGMKNLVDGYAYGQGADPSALAKLQSRRDALLAAATDEPTRRRLVETRRELADAKKSLEGLPAEGVVFAAATEFSPIGTLSPTHGKPRPIFLLHRGSEKDPEKEVGPGTVSFLPDLPSRFELPPGADESQRRAALASWVVDSRNPLAWRSIVNRVWQYHFGRGIVETPNDFGKMGALPTHPELLDWLATEFRDGGAFIHTPGSIKQLQRLIVLSSVYRQASSANPAYEKIDGGNQFLWRMSRDRLDAEAIHDSILLVSGLLDTKMGGPGYRNFGFQDDHSPRYKYQEYDPDDATGHRRAIYRFIVRSAPDPLMETLDCADPSQLVPRRNETLTALQALSLMNNKFIVKMADHFAQRVEKLSPDVGGQIDAAFHLALGRAPTNAESQILVPLAKKDGMANVCRLIFNMNEFVFVD